MTPDEAPPPYSPHDPNAPPSPEQRTSPQPEAEGALLPPPPPLTLGSDYLGALPRDPSSLASPAAFFEERSFTADDTPALSILEFDIHPGTCREELAYPLSIEERELRDVTEQDWATFINFLLTELGSDELSPGSEKERRWGAMAQEEFVQAKLKMDAIVSEWNDGFFMPRGLHFNAKYSFTPPTTATSSTRTMSDTTNDHADILPHSPLHSEPHELPYTLPLPQHQEGGPRMMWRRGRGMHQGAFRGRGWGPGGSGPHFGPGPHIGPGSHVGPSPHVGLGPHFDPRHVRSGWNRFQPHGGPMLSHHGWHSNQHPSTHPYGPPQVRSPSIASEGSKISLSSTDSGSTIGSLSASSMSGADAEDVREAIAAFHIDPSKQSDLKSAVRALFEDLRSKERQTINDAQLNSQEAKLERKKNKKAVRTELRNLKAEIRSLVREKKRERREEKRALKAERRAAKGKHKARAPSSAKWASKGRSALPQSPPPRHGALTPPPDVPRSEGTATLVGSEDNYSKELPTLSARSWGLKLSQLSKADRKLEERARRLDMHADHWEGHAKHWDHQMEHYASVYAKHEQLAVHAEERVEVSLTPCSTMSPQRIEKAAQARAKRLQRSEEARQKRLAAAEAHRQKLLAQRRKADETSLEFRRQAAELRAQMEQYSFQSTEESSQGQAPGTPGQNVFEHIGREFESWGEQFGRDMSVWGEQFGNDMQAWGRQVATKIAR